MILSGAAPVGKELEDSVRAKLPHATLGQVIISVNLVFKVF